MREHVFYQQSPREVQGGDFVLVPRIPREETQRRAAEMAAGSRGMELPSPAVEWDKQPGLARPRAAAQAAKHAPKLTSSSSSSSALSSLGCDSAEEDRNERKPPQKDAPSAGMARGDHNSREFYPCRSERDETEAKGENLNYIDSNCHSLGTDWPLYHKAARRCKCITPASINRDCRVIQGCPAVRSYAVPQTQGCWSPEFMLILFCVSYTYYRCERWTIKKVEH